MNKKVIIILSTILLLIILVVILFFWLDKRGYVKIFGDVTQGTVEAQLENDITLNLNQSALINTQNLKITLSKFEDSRCPSNVTCVWAGEVKVTLAASYKGYNLGDIIFYDSQLTKDGLKWADEANIIKKNNYSFMLTGISSKPLIDKNSGPYIKIKVSKIKKTALKNINFSISLEGKKSKVSKLKSIILDADKKEFADWFTTQTDNDGKASVIFNNYLRRGLTYLKADNYLSDVQSVDMVDLKSYYSQPEKDTQDVNVSAMSLSTGDLNNDDMINSLDFSVLNSKWGSADRICDLNEDGVVNSLDFSFINKNWGKIGQALKEKIVW